MDDKRDATGIMESPAYEGECRGGASHAMPVLSPALFERLRHYVEAHSGILIQREKIPWLERRLGPLLPATGCDSFETFCAILETGVHPELLDAVVEEICLTETLWFRDGWPFRLLSERVWPRLAEELAHGPRRVRLWSAAASTGQEPYSMAISLREFRGTDAHFNLQRVEILGTDFSGSAIAFGKRGRYGQAAMESGPSMALRRSYFTQGANGWLLKPSLRRMVDLRRFNLKLSPAPLGQFDVVFLRYVARYCGKAFQAQLATHMAEALRPGGVLVLGNQESLPGLEKHFETAPFEEGRYFVRRD